MVSQVGGLWLDRAQVLFPDGGTGTQNWREKWDERCLNRRTVPPAKSDLCEKEHPDCVSGWQTPQVREVWCPRDPGARTVSLLLSTRVRLRVWSHVDSACVCVVTYS